MIWPYCDGSGAPVPYMGLEIYCQYTHSFSDHMLIRVCVLDQVDIQSVYSNQPDAIIPVIPAKCQFVPLQDTVSILNASLLCGPQYKR